MAFQKPQYSKNQVSQKFNLEELTGVNLDGHSDLRNAIAQDIIDRIDQRTTSDNVDISGKPFQGYKESYYNSDRFADFGKSKNDVDMTLRGRMLEDIDIIVSSGSDVEIGFSDETEILKAYNHNTGDTVTKRQFFGLRKKEFNEIIAPYKAELKEIKKAQREEDSDILFGTSLTATAEEAQRLDLGALFGSLFES